MKKFYFIFRLLLFPYFFGKLLIASHTNIANRKRMLLSYIKFCILISFIPISLQAATITATNSISGPIRDNRCLVRTLNISSSVTITNVTMELNLIHSYRGDLDIYLGSPSSTWVQLSRKDYYNNADNLHVIYDDSAATSIQNDYNNHTTLVDRRPYQALSNFDGEDSQGNWTLYICDNYNGDQGTYQNATLRIEYTPPAPPTISPIPDQYVDVGTTFSLDVSSYTTGNNLTYSATGLPPGLTIDSSTGVISGTPTTVGTYPVTVTVSNGTPPDASTTFNIIVSAPVLQAANDTYTTSMNQTLTVSAPGVLSNDSGLNKYVSAYTQPNSGTVTLNSDGSFTYVPDTGFTGTVNFQYTIQDSTGSGSSSAIVTIIVQVVTDYEDEGTLGFTQINPESTQNVIGDYKIMGNTVLCLTTLRTGYATSEDQCVDTTNLTYDATSNNYVTKFIDIDNDPTTWNSSSSFITLPDIYAQNGGQGILWAGLIWQGRFAWENSSECGGRQTSGCVSDLHYGSASGWVETGTGTGITSVDLENDAKVNKIKLKIDSGNYNTVTAYKVYSLQSLNGITYSSIADVTSLLRSSNLNAGKHTFTVANLPTEEGREYTPGVYGGWSLVVIYAEDPFLGKPRNITIYGGMGHLVSKSSATPIEISGFKLPSAGSTVNAHLSIFSGEGEHDYSPDGVDISLSNSGPWIAIPETGNNTNVFDAVLSNVSRDTIPGHKNDLANNNVGVDVDNFDISNIVSNFPRSTTSMYLRWWSDGDYIIPSMIAFTTELYRPTLCYDYTLDVGGIIIPSTDNEINTNLGIYTNTPMTTRISIRSNEGDFVLNDVNVSYRIADTNQTQYIIGSTMVAPNGVNRYEPATSQTFNESIQGFGIYIGENAGPGQGGSIAPYQTTYFKFNNDLNGSVDTTFDLRAQFTVDYGSGPVPQAMVFDSTHICKNSGGYFPALGIFNVISDTTSTNGIPYNLQTQIADRAFNVKMFSYDPADLTSLMNSDTTVEVELYNAGLFSRDVNLTCKNPDSNITVPFFVPFNNTYSVDLTGLRFNVAIRNTAFRTWYLSQPDGSVLQHHCTDRYDNDCFETLYADNYATHEGPDGNCTTDCTTGVASGSDSCYSCLRAFYGTPVCSRDNFSIRPESFSVKLYDTNEDNSTTAPAIELADSHTVNAAKLAAGYKYRYEINASSFRSDSAVPRYFMIFDNVNSGPSVREWSPSGSVSGCNDTSGKPLNTVLFNGTNLIAAAPQVYTPDPVEQVGEYAYIISDQNWTRADWDPAVLTHHTSASTWLFSNGTPATDCEKDSNTTYAEGSNHIQGCVTTNVHDTGRTYIPLKLEFHPYSYDVSGLSYGAGPSMRDANGSVVYMNTLSQSFPYPEGYYTSSGTQADENMSFNIQGKFFAESYTGQLLTNYVAGCYAEPVDMNLSHTFMDPVSSLYTWRYDLIDTNETDQTDIILPREDNSLTIAADSVVTQNAANFRSDMQGAIFMDLGYNFDRYINIPLNPVRITFGDMNLSNANKPDIAVNMVPDHKIYGLLNIDQRVHFYYGRVKPAQPFYDNIATSSATTPVSVVIYCDATPITAGGLGISGCNARGLSLQSNEIQWWKAVDHNTSDGDGSIGLTIGTLTEGSGSPYLSNASVAINASNGENNTLFVDRGSNPTLPMTVPVELLLYPNAVHTDRWLIYNEFNSSAPSPFYRVRFIGTSGWAGEGETGHVVNDNADTHKNKRVGW